jgi:hypothetical protein
MAWLVGEGIIIYRSVKVQKAPPGPGQLALTSGLFIGLALLAEMGQARTIATMLAWGVDLAAFMKLSQDAKKAPESSVTKKPLWPPAEAPNNTVFPTGAPLSTLLKPVNR